ncbi:MAG: ThiF family adenylyltransferase [Acidobacteriia bacterium]|nr:ThiF family adenylyltransferase [Terriglobia bacterium]
MNDTVVFPGATFQRLRSQLLASDRETCAVLLALPLQVGRGTKFIVKEEIYFGEGDYVERSGLRSSLRSETVFTIAQKAKRQNQSVVFVHTHPGVHGFPQFSTADDKGEAVLAPFLKQYFQTELALSLILAAGGCAGRIIPCGAPLRIVEASSEFTFLSKLDAEESEFERSDRHIRALGRSAVPILQNLKIGIVGLGGTGSLTAQQLAYLGVRDFVLMDDDVIELTNLNRVVGASQTDVNRPKTKVTEDLIRRIAPAARVRIYDESVLEDVSVRKLLDRDLLFCCTDSHGSRAVMNQFAYQYVIPCIDMAISISTTDEKISYIVGRIQLLAPGLGCLTCGGLLDAGEVRVDLMREHERRRDPYFLGQAEPQPAVISLNSTVSSLAVTMFLGTITHAPLNARFQHYDAIAGIVRSVEHRPRPNCIVCSESGALARGDTWPLPTRKSP